MESFGIHSTESNENQNQNQNKLLLEFGSQDFNLWKPKKQLDINSPKTLSPFPYCKPTTSAVAISLRPSLSPPTPSHPKWRSIHFFRRSCCCCHFSVKNREEKTRSHIQCNTQTNISHFRYRTGVLGVCVIFILFLLLSDSLINKKLELSY